MKKIIITGSSGLIGKKIVSYFRNRYKLIPIDLKLGHNLNDENQVKKIFRKNSNANYLFSSCESIEITQNKELFLKKLNDSGINSPKIITPSNINEKLKFPIFINNKFGSNSTFSQKIYTVDQYNFIKKQIPNPFVTEYIQGEEFSIDCFINKKKEIVSIVPRTRKYVFKMYDEKSICKRKSTKIWSIGNTFMWSIR